MKKITQFRTKKLQCMKKTKIVMKEKTRVKEKKLGLKKTKPFIQKRKK